MSKEKTSRNRMIAFQIECGHTYKEVGKTFGISKQRVEQVANYYKNKYNPKLPDGLFWVLKRMKCLGTGDLMILQDIVKKDLYNKLINDKLSEVVK